MHTIRGIVRLQQESSFVDLLNKSSDSLMEVIIPALQERDDDLKLAAILILGDLEHRATNEIRHLRAITNSLEEAPAIRQAARQAIVKIQKTKM